MKNILLILSLFIATCTIANELKWVDEQIQAIKPPRSGISKSQIDMIQNPFIFLKQESKEKPAKKVPASRKSTISKQKISTSTRNKLSKKSASFTLSAIINKSALINGKWYELHSKVGAYTLSSIDVNSVVLSYKKKKVFLSTRSKTKKLKFKNN